MSEPNVGFLRRLRGYHVYQALWTPAHQEDLFTEQESNNAFDRYAIAADAVETRWQPLITGLDHWTGLLVQ